MSYYPGPLSPLIKARVKLSEKEQPPLEVFFGGSFIDQASTHEEGTFPLTHGIPAGQIAFCRGMTSKYLRNWRLGNTLKFWSPTTYGSAVLTKSRFLIWLERIRVLCSTPLHGRNLSGCHFTR
ncbi:uncharacterized protein LOC111252544 [Varroa destructor]|uniref:Uncharacterized protein n=1 Tax=Varroa destructor TaxID=109461 RepID=A0A7M7KIQ6_VARDE|nr:uncharacterized protein LOC111252544 [Varroa destructor]